MEISVMFSVHEGEVFWLGVNYFQPR